MKVRINECDLNGKLIHNSGELICGDNYLAIVEGMKLSPFTAGIEPLTYMREVFGRLGLDAAILPAEPEDAAREFLLKIASIGRIQFLVDSGDEDYERKEVPPCTKD